MEILVLALIPVMLESLEHRLGAPLAWIRAWWLLVVVAAVCALAPREAWSGLAAGVVLIPALGMAAGGVVRLMTATRSEITDGTRSSWLVGQAAISVGLAGLAVLGWFLVAQVLGVSGLDLPVARAVVGIFAIGLIAGELALASAGRIARTGAAAALVTALLALVPGVWWLLSVAVTLVIIGLTQRLEIRPVLPGAPGLGGWAGLVGGPAVGVVALSAPGPAAILASLSLAIMAWRWTHIMTRLATKSNDGGCACCSGHDSAAAGDAAQQHN